MTVSLNVFYLLSFLAAIIAFLFALYLYLWVKKEKVVNGRIEEVSALIAEGARTFMRREYRILAIFASVVAVVIFLLLPTPIWSGGVLDNIMMVAAYIAGTVLSAIAGRIGIMVATLSNGRTAEKAQHGLKDAFLIGGGIGIPPMLELAKELAGRYGREHVTAVLGYRDSQLFLKEEFEPFAKVYVATEDGKLVWECPHCGNRDENTLNVARRTCGYIGTQFWNQGRTQEIKERVLHL